MLLHKVLKEKKPVIPACWSESWQSSSFSEKFTDTYETADFTVNTEKQSTTLNIYTKMRYVHSMHSSNTRTGTVPQSRNPFHINCNECLYTEALKWSSYTKPFPHSLVPKCWHAPASVSACCQNNTRNSLALKAQWANPIWNWRASPM